MKKAKKTEQSRSVPHSLGQLLAPGFQGSFLRKQCQVLEIRNSFRNSRRLPCASSLCSLAIVPWLAACPG